MKEARVKTPTKKINMVILMNLMILERNISNPTCLKKHILEKSSNENKNIKFIRFEYS